MERRYDYYKDEQDKHTAISSMKKYVVTKQEIDKFFEEIISPFIKSRELKILDACCGIGHICNLLSKISPKSTFLGIDQTSYLIDEARKIFSDKKNILFKVDDVYDLPTKYSKAFDITINWKTISWLPYYDQIIKSLMSVTKKHIFLSSLFYDGDIDFEIKIREFKKERGKESYNSYYNVYSFPHFQKFVYDLGAKNIESYNFEMNLDLPKHDIDYMGTYTEKLENGKRLQISGPVIMLWKIIRIDL